MAQKVQTLLVDDITGKEIAAGEGETIRFAVNGTDYEIDLDTKSAKKFHDSLGLYIDHARKVGRATVTPIKRGGRRSGPAGPEVDLAAVRAWAESNGYQVSHRGRIKTEIMDAYRAAN